MWQALVTIIENFIRYMRNDTNVIALWELRRSLYLAANPAATRAQALRATMLDLMDKAVPPDTLGSQTYTYAHPMFWAQFSLVGDGGR